jgi:hypothetical protein
MRHHILDACRIAGVVAACAMVRAHAGEFDLGDTKLRWDTTLRATLAVRTEPADRALLGDINGDDGDRAFGTGPISERLDVVSQLDISRGDLGFDVSADGWYDAVYHQRSDNRSAVTFNPVTVPNTGFPAATRALDGDTAELLTAYVHDRVSLLGLPLTLRLGRQTLIWGESLFFANNGIATGQGPVDVIKSLSQPLAQARELFLPVNQAVSGLQMRPGVVLEAYTQFEWRADRLPGVASYFSTSDILDAGGERFFDGGTVLLRSRDRRPPGLGQFGVALHVSTDIADFGFYALRFDAKSPQIFLTPRNFYGLVYPRGIALYGVSASTYLGDANLAGEVSLRQHMPLVSALPPLPGPSALYAAGETLHGQVSLVDTLPPGRFWQGADLEAELAANERLSVTRDPGSLAKGLNAFAAELRVVFTPQYFQVLPHLDLTVPIGFSLDVAGRSSVDEQQVPGAGDIDAGLLVTYFSVWQAGLSFTHFLGNPGHQKLGDRDFVAMTLSRTF